MKWLAGILVLLVLAVGGAWYFGFLDAFLAPPPAPAPQVSAPQSQSGLPTADTDASDAALSQDSAAIDAQLNALVQHEAEVDVLLADKPLSNSLSEIDRRLSALQKVVPQVLAMEKVTTEFKQNLSLNIQNQISGLTALKSQIATSTVTASYRVFALLMPQVTIAVAADRIVSLVDMMVGVGNKLQARISQAGESGKDVTALTVLLSSLGEKLTQAQLQAQASLDNSATLSPDQGNATLMQQNTASLKKARTALTEARTALSAARGDINAILQGLAGLSVTATTTTQVQIE
jgi:hypothetical protein